MEPFTGAYIWQTSDKSMSDRNFYDFKKHWEHIVMQDEKTNAELIPEYFYMPEVFDNKNCVYLGMDDKPLDQ